MDVKYVEIGGSFSKRIQCKRNHCSKEYGEEIAGRTTSTYYEHNCIGYKQALKFRTEGVREKMIFLMKICHSLDIQQVKPRVGTLAPSPGPNVLLLSFMVGINHLF